jgi:hypothetical protein
VKYVFSYPENFDKTSPACRGYSTASANRKFQFQETPSVFIGTHNETLSVRVGNPDCSPIAIRG